MAGVVERLDQPDPPRPRDRGIHRAQELLPARHPPAIRVLDIGEADLVAGHDEFSQKRPTQTRQNATHANEKISDSLGIEGIRSSIGTVADAYDNTLMEPVMGLFKTECIRTTAFHVGPYRNFADVE